MFGELDSLYNISTETTPSGSISFSGIKSFTARCLTLFTIERLYPSLGKYSNLPPAPVPTYPGKNATSVNGEKDEYSPSLYLYL